ncbi:hypothetical protein B7463_g10965, partial [Scytalidium lignicola]
MAGIQSIIFITGGNNGIGFYTCNLLASTSNYHVIMGSRSLEKGQKALADIQSQNPSSSISLVQIDITSDSSIASAVQEVKAKYGRLDVLINNAGICPVTFSRDILRETLEINTTSPAIVTESFTPLLRNSRHPRVIYVSSTLRSIGIRSDPNSRVRSEDYKAYRISKAALNMLTACDAWEYEKDGFKVFAYCPGYVVTDLAGMRDEKLKQGAATPERSARGLLAIAEGKRDLEAGKFLHGEASGMVYPW